MEGNDLAYYLTWLKDQLTLPVSLWSVHLHMNFIFINSILCVKPLTAQWHNSKINFKQGFKNKAIKYTGVDLS